MQETSINSTQILGRLEEFRAQKGLNVEQFAHKLGIASNNYRNYLKGETRKVPLDLLVAVLGLGLSPNWLLTGEGPMLKADQPLSGRLPHEGFEYVPLFEADASAGPGSENPESPPESLLAFRSDWLRYYVGASVQDLFGLTVDGESMEPTLRNRDTILVDRTKAHSRLDGIYVIRDEGTLKVKRLAFLRGHRIRIISDNAIYPAQEIEEGVPDFSILGRVIWVGRTIAAGG